ncbi:MAG TPA: hypothetical protein VLO11_08225 [Luteolibacter sp.]|nr:hypothetical protein [Luteolibacter sp.]
MMRSLIQHGLLVVALSVSPLAARQIKWASDPSVTNLTSDNSSMDDGFQFELGVFEGSFVPTLSNKDEWAANWRPAKRVDYNPATQAFDGEFLVENNDPPFTIDKPAYVWGWRLAGNAAEWILFRDATWNWPEVDPFPGFSLEWDASEATAIIGDIDATGSPFLMKSAAVTGAASPTTTWEQWQAKQLAGEPQNGPQDDPDEDGTPNLLEFVFDTDPLTATPPPQTPVTMIEDGGDSFLQISIPRRIEHAAELSVEVSPDLAAWQSGPLHTQVVADDLDGLVVRDLTPLSPSAPARFMRLKATLP